MYFFLFYLLIYIIMKKYFKYVIIFLLFLSNVIMAQTPLPIYSPNFSSAGGWQINGNAAVISSSYLRLTPNAGGQAGSAFWKQKVSLPDNFSFATYFVSRMTPGSRADGMTFCIQQASNTAGSVGGGLGYQGIPGKSIGIEYDIYDNGEVGGNNHIALDINGVLHTGSTNVIASPVNLADGTNKYNWIEYNGVTNVLQVRISNTNVRPTNPTLSVTINLATNFIGVSDVYFGFTAATGGATAEHAVYTAYVAPNSTPLSSTGSYSQGVASITLASSNAISCTALTSTITVTTKDVNGIGMPTNLLMSSDVGGGTLSAYTLTTNSSGIGTVIFTSNSGTLASNTIRAEEPNVGAYGTIVVTKTGTIPIGGSIATTNATICTGGTAQLTLSGQTGNINKWQRSTDNINWTNITNTTTSLSESISSTTYYRVEIQATGCTTVTYSSTGIVSVVSPPTGGIVSSGVTTATLTLTGYTGTITKWQKSIDNGATWTDIINTTTTYSYINQTDGTQFRAVLTNGYCTSNSTAGIVTLPFTYTTYIYNSESNGILGIPVKLYYKLKTDTNYNLYITSNTDINGLVNFSTPYGVSLYDFRLSIDNLTIPTPNYTDASYLITKILQQSFNSRDYYRFDTNDNNTLNISDAFLVFYRVSGGIGTWTYLIPPYRIFTETEWNTINSSNSNLKTTYPGTQTLILNNLISGLTSRFYLVRTGYKQ
jgi:hypothetical protein